MNESPLPISANKPKRAEWIAVLVLLGIFFIFNLLTYNSYPAVWADEVLWSEPAINLVTTGHFTTSVWQFQPAGSFWAAQSPLYCFLLSGWLPLVGNSLAAVRSFNFLLVSVAAFLVWFASWRYQLLCRPLHRVLIVPLLLLGYGISFAYRSSRPDMAGLVSLVGLGLAFSARTRRGRDLLLFIAAAITPWVGIQIGLFAFLACVAAKLVYRPVTYRDLMAVCLGLFVGGCSMLFFFYTNGVLPDFMASMSQATHERMYWGHAPTYLESIPGRLKTTLSAYTGDFSCIPLLLGLALFWICSRGDFSQAARRTIAYLLMLFFAIPLIFTFTAHFAFYYSYMIYVPLVVAFLIAYSQASAEKNGKPGGVPGTAFTLPILGAVLLGLPLRLGLAGSFSQIMPRAEAAKIIQAHLKPDDVIFAHYTGFFEAKQVAQRVYSPMYSRSFVDLSPHAQEFSAEERSRINVMIIPATESDRIRDYFGGKWEAVSEPFGDTLALGDATKIPLIGGRIGSYFASPQGGRQKLQIWRRPAG